MVIGLTQADSAGRYLAMSALRRALPVIKETLTDDATRHVSYLILLKVVKW